MKSKYVNPFTDFGFKKIFGEEASKPMLIDFLNALLPNAAPIVDLSFKNLEKLGQTVDDRRAVYDIYCENERGEKFIVELQKARQNYFRERMVYYSTFPIQEEAEKGEWDFNMKAVYCIGLLGFRFEDYATERERQQVVHEIKLRDKTGKTFYDKLTYMYVEIPNFQKTEMQLETRLDKWLYFIKNLEDFDRIPDIFAPEVVFVAAFHKAELATYNRTDLASYEDSLKSFRDLKNVIDTANEEGARIGRIEGTLEGILIEKRNIAVAMKQKGMATGMIAELTGLSEEEIASL